LQYQQLRHSIDQQGPSLSGELHIFCSVTAAYSHLPPILDRFRAAHPSVEIKLTTGDAADAMEKVVTGEADLAIAGKPETLPGAVAFSMLENLAVVLIAPALPCPVRNQVSVEKPDWSTVPFIMADQGPVRRRIELWFRRQKISNPSIYATVSGHEAMVSMVALGCGVALLPEVVLENSPEPVRNRVMILERSDEKTPFELGVCAQKSGCMSRLLMRSGRYCRTTKLSLPGRSGTPGYGFRRDTHSPARSAAFRNPARARPVRTPPARGRSRCRGCGSGTGRCSSACPACAGT
jgi:LysR family positive regulator for ilvC